VKPTLWSHRADTEHMEHLSDALQKSWKRSDERRWNIHYMHIYVCIQCIYTYVYMCMYIYMWVCIYIYVYIHAYSYHIYIVSLE
jgi:23S rRNA A1618 N6-methylase RlmF